MRDEILGDDGYPSEQELKTISGWIITKEADIQALLEYVRARWTYPEYFGYQPERLADGAPPNKPFGVSTGGWSGNESLIGALEDNLMFWACCWHRSERGGHYVFDSAPFGDRETGEDK